MAERRYTCERMASCCAVRSGHEALKFISKGVVDGLWTLLFLLVGNRLYIDKSISLLNC